VNAHTRIEQEKAEHFGVPETEQHFLLIAPKYKDYQR
jgi:hypothetical protein